MGCNCGGSTPKVPKDPQVIRMERQQQTVRERNLLPPPPKRAGGPGEPGYYSRQPDPQTDDA